MFWSILFCSFAVLEPQDPTLIVGSHLNVSCKINLTHPFLDDTHDARNIYFKLKGKKMSQAFVHVADNFTRADLSYPNISLAQHGNFVSCYVDNGNKDENEHIFVDSQHILVGCK